MSNIKEFELAKKESQSELSRVNLKLLEVSNENQHAVEELKSQVEEEVSKVQTSKAKIRELEGILEHNIYEKEELVKNLQFKCNEKESEIIKLKDEIIKLKDEMVEQINTAECRIKELHDENEQNKKIIVQSKLELESYMSQAEFLVSEKEKMNEEKEAIHKRAHELKIKLGETLQNFSSREQNLEESLNKEKKKLDEAMMKLNNKSSELMVNQKRLADLESFLERLKSESEEQVISYETEKISFIEEIGSLRSDNKTVRELMQATLDENSQLCMNVRDLEESKQLLSNEILSLTESRRALEEKLLKENEVLVEKYRGEVETFRLSLEEKEKELKKAQVQREEHAESIVDLNNKIDLLTKDNCQKLQQIDSLQEDIQSLNLKITNQQESNKELEESIANSKQEAGILINELNSEKDLLLIKIDEITKENNQSMLNVEKLENKLLENEETLKLLERTKAEAEDTIDKMQNQIDQMQSELKLLKENLEKSQRDVEVLSLDHFATEEALSEKNKQSKKFEEIVQSIEKDNLDLKEEISGYEKKLADLDKLQQDQQVELEEKIEKMATCQKEFHMHTKESERIKNDLTSSISALEREKDSFKQQLLAAEEKLTALDSDISKRSEENHNLKKENKILCMKLEENEQRFDLSTKEKDKELEETKLSLQGREKEVVLLNQEYAELRSENENKLMELNAMREQVKTVEEINEKMRFSVSDLEESLARLREDSADLTKEKVALNGRNKELEEKLQDNAEEKETLRKDLDHLKSSLETEINLKNDLQISVDTLQENLHKWTAQNDDQKIVLLKTIEELNHKCQGKEEKIAEHEEAIVTLKTEISEINSKLENTEKSFQETGKQLQGNLEELRNDIFNKEKLIDGLTNKNTTLIKQNEELCETNEYIETIKAELNSELATLRDRCKTQLDDLNDFERKYSKVENELQTTKNLLQQEKDKHFESDKQRTEIELELSKVSEILKSTKESLEYSETVKEELSTQLLSKSNEVERINTEMKAIGENLEEQKNEHTKEIQELNAEMELLRKEKEEIEVEQKKLSELENAMTVINITLKETRDDKEKFEQTVRRLQEQLSDSEEQCKRFKRINNENIDTLRRTEDLLRDEKENNNCLKSQITNRNCEFAALQSQLDDERTKTINLQSTISSKQEIISGLTGDIGLKKSQIQNQVDEMNRNLSRIKELEKELEYEAEKSLSKQIKLDEIKKHLLRTSVITGSNETDSLNDNIDFGSQIMKLQEKLALVSTFLFL